MHGAQEYLLYDTVGFVSDLPHTLVEAFHSTLDAARDADLLIHVIDYADPAWQKKREITMDTLREIGADKIPVLTVFNKIDLLEDPAVPGLGISCRTGAGLEEVSAGIADHLYPKQITMNCLLPYDKMALFDAYRKFVRIEILEQKEDGMRLKIEGPAAYAEQFRMYEEKKEG
jgi:GTP-binding protein HflX